MLLGNSEIELTADWICDQQTDDGLILWFKGGHGDPWNHVEAAMALSIASRIEKAELAYQWLRKTQRNDGSWWNYYLEDSVEDYRVDTNVCAYIAVGVLHHFKVTKDIKFLELMWESVEKALDFVVSLQQPGGEILWCIEPDGSYGKYALLTGSASILMSLKSGLLIANELKINKFNWVEAYLKLKDAIRTKPNNFAPKFEYAMDWYYPILSGAMDSKAAQKRLNLNYEIFVDQDKGVRCVSKNEWFTVAETAELILTLDQIGQLEIAKVLFESTFKFRQSNGSYLTGIVYPDFSTFPKDECSTYSAAAVLLANSALDLTLPASDFFRFLSSDLSLLELF
jgi:hypothetical protein